MFRKLCVFTFSLLLLLLGTFAPAAKGQQSKSLLEQTQVESLPGIDVKHVDGSGHKQTCNIYRIK